MPPISRKSAPDKPPVGESWNIAADGVGHQVLPGSMAKNCHCGADPHRRWQPHPPANHAGAGPAERHNRDGYGVLAALCYFYLDDGMRWRHQDARHQQSRRSAQADCTTFTHGIHAYSAPNGSPTGAYSRFQGQYVDHRQNFVHARFVIQIFSVQGLQCQWNPKPSTGLTETSVDQTVINP